MSRPRDLLAGAGSGWEAGVASPEHDAAELLAHVLGTTRSRLPLIDDVPLDLLGEYDALIARRAEREPLQHLTGVAHFRHVELFVGPGVFVPRPETELLAGWAIEQCQALSEEYARRSASGEGSRWAAASGEGSRWSSSRRDAGAAASGEGSRWSSSRRDAGAAATRDPVVVDLCTGSGAIAKAVADEVPGARVHAVELDEPAYAWAERNLVGTGVDLRQGDFATAFDDLLGTVDVLTCNPPYIPLEAWESVAPEARDHDPHLALFSGDDGLDAIRVLEHRAAQLLRPGGVLGFEHADVQGESAPEVLTASGRWSDVRDHVDLAGRARFTTARLAR